MSYKEMVQDLNNKAFPTVAGGDSLDWKHDATPDSICKRVTSKVKNGSIVLFHNDADHRIENDIDGLLPFDFRSTYIIGKDSYMMQLVSAEEMKEALLASDDPKRKAWGERMKFDDNDILVLAKLKK